MLTEPHVGPLTMPSLTLPNQPLSLALPTPPLMGGTCLQTPPQSSGTPSMLSPLPMRTTKTMLKT